MVLEFPIDDHKRFWRHTTVSKIKKKEWLLELIYQSLFDPILKRPMVLSITILISEIYMPIEEFNDEYILPLLEKASKENKPLILLGDFNINLLKSDSDNSVSNFLDILGSFSLLPQIIFPTRLTNTSKTLIDNIFIDSSTFQVSPGNADAGKLRRLSCSEDDFIYFLPVAATSLRAGFQVYLSKPWVVDVTKEVRYDLSTYCLLSDIILSFLLVAATSLRAGFQVYLF